MYEGYGIGNSLIFWTLRILLLGVLAYCGWGISHDKPQKFKFYAWMAGIFYSLIQGLRWMRGADYYHYYNDLVTLFGQYSENLFGRGTVTKNPDLLYDWWVHVFFYSNLPFWIAFIAYSAILIWGLLLILRKYPRAAYWALPMFFILTPSAENIIRQYIAEAVLLFVTYFYLYDNRKKMIIGLCAIPLIHFSGIIISFLFLFIILLPKKLINILCKKQTFWFLFLLYSYLYYFWDISGFSDFANWLNSLDLEDDIKGYGYLENADRWFTYEGSISSVLGNKTVGISFVNNLFRYVSFGSIIWLGFESIKRDTKLLVFFLFSYFAILCKVMGGDIEMFGRFYNWFVILMPILMGYYMSNIYEKRYIGLRIALYIVYGLYFLWSSFLANIFSSSMFGYGFVWDK